jgi:hypothetical protein
MLHEHATMVGLAVALLCLASTVVFAQSSGREESWLDNFNVGLRGAPQRWGPGDTGSPAPRTGRLHDATVPSLHAAQPSLTDVPSVRPGTAQPAPGDARALRRAPASRAESGVVGWSGVEP